LSFARASSVAVVGMDGHPVDVEVQVVQGLPAFTVVGLPDAAIQESRERVRAAVESSGETWPKQRLTVNLSPAHLPKQGSGFDLAIALAVLAACSRISQQRLDEICAIGELSLDGKVRRIRGVLAAVAACAARGVRRVLVPSGNAAEAALIDGVEVIPLTALAEAVRLLRGECLIDAAVPPPAGAPPDHDVDLADVRGQSNAKRALMIAAAGGHNMIMTGLPGGGKTMLARRMPTILPPLDHDEAMIVTRLYSVAGQLPPEAGMIRQRPFRAPHHSISTAGLVGGGSGIPMPGEVSLAHRGVLFLDEASEFRRDALQALRQPIEDGFVTLSRARFTVGYPSRFQLVLAANPCPCGHTGDPLKVCECAPGRIVAYKERLSGPLIDRVDLGVNVERVKRSQIFADPGTETSTAIRASVVAARERQRGRLAALGITTNAEIPPGGIERTCAVTKAALAALEDVVATYAHSMRGTHRLIRVARTIADLEGSDRVHEGHVAEAAGFRVRL